MRPFFTAAVAAALALSSPSALASFHDMQIEQVIAGANGDVKRQAIQLRMRRDGQNQLMHGRLVAWDANGENPVILAVFETAVPNALLGDRVLIATPEFATDPDGIADVLMQQPIPESYIDAGRLTYENHDGQIFWSLCWGGSAYTGGTEGCVDGPLPASSRQALLFDGTAEDTSTTNAADYIVTAGPAEFTSNLRVAGTVDNAVIHADGFDR